VGKPGDVAVGALVGRERDEHLCLHPPLDRVQRVRHGARHAARQPPAQRVQAPLRGLACFGGFDGAIVWLGVGGWVLGAAAAMAEGCCSVYVVLLLCVKASYDSN
jgi:hypothetical protein